MSDRMHKAYWNLSQNICSHSDRAKKKDLKIKN